MVSMVQGSPICSWLQRKWGKRTPRLVDVRKRVAYRYVGKVIRLEPWLGPKEKEEDSATSSHGEGRREKSWARLRFAPPLFKKPGEKRASTGDPASKRVEDMLSKGQGWKTGVCKRAQKHFDGEPQPAGKKQNREVLTARPHENEKSQKEGRTYGGQGSHPGSSVQ